MTATTYFGNRAKAAVVAAGGTPGSSDLFTVGRGFEANIVWESADLFGMDSILRVDQAKYQLRAEAKLKGCQFDPGGSGIMDMIFSTLNGAAGGSGGITDTNDMFLMDVWIYQVGSGSANPFSVKVTDAYMENVPFSFPENDFMILDLSFKGKSAVLGTSSAP